jgi:hypothetical protein
LINLTRDGGTTWANVTPPKNILAEWSQINAIDPSPFDPATAYVAATMYKSDDFHPYLYKTTDYGKTWTEIVSGIPENHFTRVVREDPNHRGVLFAGTEFGIYISYDSGDHWQSIQLNLPVVPITDLEFQKRDDELVVATEGRAFWIMDDLALLSQLKGRDPAEDLKLFQPKSAVRFETGRGAGGVRSSLPLGENPPSGAVIEFWLKTQPRNEVTLEFLDTSGKLINKYSSRALQQDSAAEPGSAGPARVPAQAGMNRFVWDLHYPDAVGFPNLIMWAGTTRGPMAIPGNYQVRLTVDGKVQTQSFAIVKDPRLKTTPDDFEKQLTLSLQIRDKLSQTNQTVIDIREAKRQLNQYLTLWRDYPAAKNIVDQAQELTKRLSAVEEELYQVRNQAREDPLNYPIKLNNRLASLLTVVESTDDAPTKQSYTVYEGLAGEVNAQLRVAEKLLKEDVSAFNKMVRDAA